MRKFFLMLGFITFATVALANSAARNPSRPQVIFETSKGMIVLELFPDKAPIAVENFLGYVRSGFYDGTIFHRVIHGFMIQGGGFTLDMKRKPTNPPIANEAENGLKNERGTIAMARMSDPHSATSQFFINTVDNHFLNHKGKNVRGWGYTVFGREVEGMDTVDFISKVKTGKRGLYRDVPAEPVVIQKAKILK